MFTLRPAQGLGQWGYPEHIEAPPQILRRGVYPEHSERAPQNDI